MTAYNVVRFRVKDGREHEFEDRYRQFDREMPGFRRGALIRTGERAYCTIGEWESFENIVDARPTMIGNLDKLRDILEDLGPGMGVTDPVSGEAVIEFTPTESKSLA